MTGFSLLRLPLLPLKSVIDMMYLGELISFHLCSEKTHRLLNTFKKSVSIDTLSSDQIKTLTAMEKYRLLCLELQTNPRDSIGWFSSIFITIEVDADVGIKIRIENLYNSVYRDFFPLVFKVECIKRQRIYTGKGGNLKIGDIVVPIVMLYNRYLCTFWTDLSDGLKTLVNYFKGLFNSKYIDFSIEGSKERKFSQNLRTVVEGMTHQTIERCKIYGGYINDDDYKFILDNINPTVRFEQNNSINSRSDEFRHKKSFKLKDFELNPSNWFTFDNLVTTDCKHIKLCQSRLTNYEVCEYLKLWMDGKFPRLKSLTVQFKETVKFDIYSGLKSYSKIYTLVLENDTIRFKRNDTTVAEVSGSENRIHFNIL